MDILRQAKTPEDIVPVDVPYTSSLLAQILGDLADRYPFIENRRGRQQRYGAEALYDPAGTGADRGVLQCILSCE